MPPKVYDNAWLNAHEQPAREYSVDIMHSPEEQRRRMALAGGEGDPLADAKQYLSHSQDFSDIASIPSQLESLQGGDRPSLRGMTEGLATGGRWATGASLPASLVPGGQGIGAVLGVGGTLAQVPDMLRRGIAPEEGEEGPGAMEGGFAALGLLPGMRGLRGTAKGAKAPSAPSRPHKYSSEPNMADSPNFQRPSAPKPSFGGDRTTGYTQEARLRGREAGLPGTHEDANTALVDMIRRETNPLQRQADEILARPRPSVAAMRPPSPDDIMGQNLRFQGSEVDLTEELGRMTSKPPPTASSVPRRAKLAGEEAGVDQLDEMLSRLHGDQPPAGNGLFRPEAGLSEDTLAQLRNPQPGRSTGTSSPFSANTGRNYSERKDTPGRSHKRRKGR